MTLSNLVSNFFSTGSENCTAYVFDDETSFGDFCDGKRDVDILFTLCSILDVKYYLKQEYCDAHVIGFSAVEKDVIAVMIDMESEP